MPIELEILAASIVLGLAHILLASHSASLQRGYWWAAGSRDEPAPPLTGIAGRFERASHNFFETFPLFLGAVLITITLDRHNQLTLLGAQAYLGGRIAFLALYALGVPVIRSLAWNAATIGALMVLAGAFIGPTS